MRAALEYLRVTPRARPALLLNGTTGARRGPLLLTDFYFFCLRTFGLWTFVFFGLRIFGDFCVGLLGFELFFDFGLFGLRIFGDLWAVDFGLGIFGYLGGNLVDLRLGIDSRSGRVS